MKSVLFACGTEYHLLMSFVLATTTYAGQPSILLLYATNRTLPYLKRARALGIWDEVILIEPETPLSAYEALFANLLQRAQALHIFTWGFPYFNTLMARCYAAGIPVLLTDEGLLTYSPQRRFADWSVQKHDSDLLARDFSFEAVSEVWLLAPELFAETPWCPLREINMGSFLDRCREDATWRTRFAQMFDLENIAPLEAGAIYFRQYFPLMNILPPEVDAWLDEMVCTALQPVRLAIKNHPAWVNPLVKSPGNTFPAAECPWEALVLWAQMQGMPLPRLYVGITSSAMFKTALLGVNGTYLFLHRLMARYSSWQDVTVDDLINRFSTRFPQARFATPDNWEELRVTLAEISQQEGWALALNTLPTLEDEQALLREVSQIYWRRSQEQARRLQSLEQDVNALRVQTAQKEAVLREVIRLMTLTADILRKELGE